MEPFYALPYGKKAYISAHDHGRMIDGNDILGADALRLRPCR